MSGWTRHEPAVASAGDVGGDYQVSDAFSARWSTLLPDGTFGVVTRSFYESSWHGGGLECSTEYLCCYDAQEPGGTEIWSDGRTEQVGPAGADPEAAARAAVEPSDAEWAKVAR
jgi:hypothetical protein